MDLRAVTRESEDIQILERINEDALPDNERVPLVGMMESGAEVIGIYEKKEPVGFLVLRKFRNIRYLAFLAVRKDRRCRGTGGRALREFLNQYEENQVVVEFETPDPNAEKTDMRHRRKNFYLRNGFFETGWYNYYDDVEFEIGCSKREYDAEAYEDFVDFFDTIVPGYMPKPYQKKQVI